MDAATLAASRFTACQIKIHGLFCLIMNWDWEKLQQRRQRQPGSEPRHDNNGGSSNPSSFSGNFNKLKNVRIPYIKLVIVFLILLWLASGVFIVESDEEGVVLRFGQYARTVEPGLNYHFPYPFETVYTIKVSQVERVEVGFRSGDGRGGARNWADEASMLTKDENIVNVHYSVQYQKVDPVKYLFNVAHRYDANGQNITVKNAAEAAMRETIGNSTLSEALTQGKTEVQKQATELLSSILNQYDAGIRVLAVQLHDVQPPEQVLDAFKDVASAREEKNRMVNEADAYKNELLPKANGLAEETLNKARSYEQAAVYAATAEANRFLKEFEEYKKAPDITRKRMYIETMESILSQPGLEKIIIPQAQVAPVIPYMPLDRQPQKSMPSFRESLGSTTDKETQNVRPGTPSGKKRIGEM